MDPILFERVREKLRRAPLMLEQVEEEARALGSTWSQEQLALLFSVVPSVELENLGEGRIRVRLGQAGEGEALVAAIKEVLVAKGGGPLPAAQIQDLLPERFVTSVEQIKTLGRKTDGLEVVGPGLIRMVDDNRN